MNKRDKAENILSKTQRLENCYTINDDAELTQEAKDVVSLTAWDSIAKNNAVLMRKQLGFSGFTDMSDDFDEAYSAAITKLNMNKNITNMIPAKTRFRFIKRVINRVIRITVGHQQVFNNDLTELLDTYYREIVRLREENAEIKGVLEELIKQSASNEEKK